MRWRVPKRLPRILLLETREYQIICATVWVITGCRHQNLLYIALNHIMQFFFVTISFIDDYTKYIMNFFTMINKWYYNAKSIRKGAICAVGIIIFKKRSLYSTSIYTWWVSLWIIRAGTEQSVFLNLEMFWTFDR